MEDNKTTEDETTEDEITKKNTCCICYEVDNSISMVHCNICSEGHICCDCSDKILDSDNIVHYCPICRCIMVTESVRLIVSNCMIFYAEDYVESKYIYNCLSPLMKRFIKNYMQTDNWNSIQELTRVNFIRNIET
jgi:hypothetical protein